MSYINKVKANRQNKLMDKVYDGSISLEQLLAMDASEQLIDMSKCKNKIQVMQLIYEPNSEVGACTVIAGNMYTAKVETERDLEVFKKALKHLKERSKHESYGDSIWIEGYNKFRSFNFLTGKYYVYYVVTNKEMEELANKIEGMDKDSMTLEDAHKLQADLPPLVRAWQESSIDVTKDKDKRFKYNYDDFFSMLNVVSTYNKKHGEYISCNLNAIKKDNKESFVITLPSDTPDIDVLNDLLGDVNYAIRDAAQDFFNNNFMYMYRTSSMDRYAKFAPYARENKELALFIKNIYKVCLASLDTNLIITKEQYQAMRNAIYTKALDLCIDKHEVINIAISTAMCNVYLDKNKAIVVKDAKVDNFKSYPVKNIFEKEYFEAITDKVWTEEISTDSIIDITRDIKDGEVIEFVNGVSVDGSITLDVDFTGKVTEQDEKLVYEVDVYNFELLKALVVDTTFSENATPKTLLFDNGEYFASVISSLEVGHIKGVNKNILTSSSNLLGRFDSSMPVDGQVHIDSVIGFERQKVTEQRLFFITLK